MDGLCVPDEFFGPIAWAGGKWMILWLSVFEKRMWTFVVTVLHFAPAVCLDKVWMDGGWLTYAENCILEIFSNPVVKGVKSMWGNIFLATTEAKS